MRLSEKWPLPCEEEKAIIRTIVASDVMMLSLGVIVAMALEAFTSGNLSWTFLRLGWLQTLGASLLRPHWAMIAIPLVLLAAAEMLQRLLWNRSSSYRRQVMEVRRGVNGELIRLPLVKFVPLMLLVGFSEELLFRYSVFGFLVFTCTQLFGQAAALCIALIASTALFAMSHVQYHSVFAQVVVILVGLVFGLAFYLTQSLLVVAVAHAIYDIVDVLVERWRASHDDGYFGGEAPANAVTDQLEQAEKGRKAKRG